MMPGQLFRLKFPLKELKFFDKSHIFLWSFIWLILCQLTPALASDKALVVVSILPQLEFVHQITGDTAYPTIVMIPPGASAETYEPKPEQMKQLSRAKIYFKVGTNLPFEQSWLGKISALNPQMVIIDCSRGIEILSGAEEHHASENKSSHAHAHGQDPHIWCSPVNAKIIIDNMVEGFIKIDPGMNQAIEKMPRPTRSNSTR